MGKNKCSKQNKKDLRDLIKAIKHGNSKNSKFRKIIPISVFTIANFGTVIKKEYFQTLSTYESARDLYKSLLSTNKIDAKSYKKIFIEFMDKYLARVVEMIPYQFLQYDVCPNATCECVFLILHKWYKKEIKNLNRKCKENNLDTLGEMSLTTFRSKCIKLMDNLTKPSIKLQGEQMNKFDKSTFTYGYEIEWGDIPRSTIIPEELGSWEYCECDVVNLIEPYRGIAVDPLGINPPVGGEINSKPTHTWQEQVERIMQIKALFDHPTASTVNHGHLHVRIPSLRDDIDALKRLTDYVIKNQESAILACYNFKETPEMLGDKSKTYLKWDGGRNMPVWMGENIVNNATDFDDFIRIQCCGKDSVSRGRPFRYAINTYCLKHTDTVEFRLFRSSTDERHIHDSFKFAEAFIDAALNNGPSVDEILADYDYQFPPFVYDREMTEAWKKTKHESDASKKVRKLYEVD